MLAAADWIGLAKIYPIAAYISEVVTIFLSAASGERDEEAINIVRLPLAEPTGSPPHPRRLNAHRPDGAPPGTA